ncbi:hypothetical protein D0Z07_9178 [Hyphodiscus hymeniophilus]|uniref:BTB domain-containing protein n=1 Tax=Hyphodiscus hymeniophilus TaxID=353542 RepID=A0A9P6SK79_9HELO|nr:hypothetical protein D0Z07_9178 [Hyphodiscus hymeniophilus]
MRHSSHSSSATTNSAATNSPKNRLNFFSKKRQSRDDSGGSDKIFEPQHSDKILSSPFTLPDIEPVRSNGTLPSPDSFIGASHDIEFLHLRENIRRIRKAPSGPDPKKVDAVWEVYKKLREESLQLCNSLLQKSQNKHRHASLETTSIGPLDTGSLHSDSIDEISLPVPINDQWLTAIHEYKTIQEQVLDNLRNSLLITYKSYDPEATEPQLEAFLADKVLRKNLITKWRDASVHRMKSEKLLFWEQYRIRSLNYDKLKLDIQAMDNIFNVTESGEAPNMAIREYVIAKNGDTILEFANAASEIHPILRFRVSSHLLAEASPYFAQALTQKQQGKGVALDATFEFPPPPAQHTCKDGMVVKVYRMPQIELNNHDSLTILLHAAHMHNSKVPREIDFPVFVSVAEVCLRYRCTSPLELQVEYQWLPQWMHMAGNDSPDGLLLISYAFGLRGIFTRMSKTAILNAVDEMQIQSKELWPPTVRDKIISLRSAKLSQIHECCTNAVEEYFRPPQEDTERKASVGSLILTTVPRCPRGSHLCDATNLGWLMLVYNELRVLPSIMKDVGFHDLPKSPRRSIKELVDCLRLMPSAPQVHSGVCDYAPAFRSAINDIYNSIQGLTLKDVSGKSGWALSKHAEEHHMSPEVHELPVPDEDDQQVMPPMSSHETICSRILMYLDDENDLASAAMIDKGFYGAYKRNEAALLKNVMKAVKRRTMSTANPDIALARNPLRRDFLPPSHQHLASAQHGEASKYLRSDDLMSTPSPDLYDVSPPYSPINEDAPMSAEEAHKILWPDLASPIHVPPEACSSVERNEKYLMGDVAHIEDKSRMQEDTKHLRDEKDAALGLGIYKTNGNGRS